jgi:hypothetical protein
MAYTVEAVETPSHLPQSPLAAPMREERVFSPYSAEGNRARILAKQTAAASGPARPTGQIPLSREPGAEALPAPGPEETVTLSPHVAALARKEQKFRQEKAALDKKKQDLDAQLAEVAKLKAMQAKLAQKDYSDLEGVINYDEYTDYLIKKQQAQTPEQAALKKLEAEVAGIKTERQESISKQFDAAVAQRKTATQQHIAADPKLSEFKAKVEKTFPKLKLEEPVVQHILDTWENDSEELAVETAVTEVVDALKERAKQWASLLEEQAQETAPTGEAIVEELKKPLPPLKTSLKTITNQVTTGEVNRPRKSFQGMSDTERWAEARRRAEEKIKQQQLMRG